MNIQEPLKDFRLKPQSQALYDVNTALLASIQKIIINDILMSKANLNSFKKPNPLAYIINKKNPFPAKVNKSYTQRNQEQYQQEDNTKLYTFCENEQKSVIETQNDQNKPIINRQRKISLNNIQGKIFEPQTKSISKLGSKLSLNQDKKKRNNLSMATINTLNYICDKKGEKPSTTRNEEKKINISININPKTIREAELKQQKAEVFFKGSENKSYSREKIYEDKRQKIFEQKVKQSSRGFGQVQKMQLIVQEQELIKFKRKFAQQKYNLQDKIKKYQNKIAQFQQKEKQWNQEARDTNEYIEFLQVQKTRLYDQNISLKSKLKAISTDNQYYIMAKDQSRKTIKEQQNTIQFLTQQIEELKQQISKISNYSIQSKISNNDSRKSMCDNKLILLEIENNYLKKEKETFYRQKEMISLVQEQKEQYGKYQQKILTLTETNKILQQQIASLNKNSYLSDINSKTVQDCIKNIINLQQQNKLLKNRQQNHRSERVQSQQSFFQFKLDSHSRKPQQSYSSEVQFVWKRDNTDPRSDKINQPFNIGPFDCDFFLKP